MPTLLNQDVKSAKASIKDAQSSHLAGANGDSALAVSRMLSRVSAMIRDMEDIRDQLALEQARQANHGKPATTVNELRRRRGLPKL
jgi:hypothetical protein